MMRPKNPCWSQEHPIKLFWYSLSQEGIWCAGFLCRKTDVAIPETSESAFFQTTWRNELVQIHLCEVEGVSDESEDSRASLEVIPFMSAGWGKSTGSVCQKGARFSTENGGKQGQSLKTRPADGRVGAFCPNSVRRKQVFRLPKREFTGLRLYISAWN
jgi:hypothetical protein